MYIKLLALGLTSSTAQQILAKNKINPFDDTNMSLQCNGENNDLFNQ